MGYLFLMIDNSYYLGAPYHAIVGEVQPEYNI